MEDYFQVVFTSTDAILLKNNKRPIKSKYCVLFNPVLNYGHAPSKYWRHGQNNSVVEMNPIEKKLRDDWIAKHGLDEDDIFQPMKEIGVPSGICTPSTHAVLKDSQVTTSPKVAEKLEVNVQNESSVPFYIHISILILQTLLLLYIACKV